MAGLENYFPENRSFNHNDTPPGLKIKLFTAPEELLEDLKKFENQTAGLFAKHLKSVLENNNFKIKKKHREKEGLVTAQVLLDTIENDRNISAWRFRPIFEKFLKHNKIAK